MVLVDKLFLKIELIHKNQAQLQLKIESDHNLLLILKVPNKIEMFKTHKTKN